MGGGWGGVVLCVIKLNAFKRYLPLYCIICYSLNSNTIHHVALHPSEHQYVAGQSKMPQPAAKGVGQACGSGPSNDLGLVFTGKFTAVTIPV